MCFCVKKKYEEETQDEKKEKFNYESALLKNTLRRAKGASKPFHFIYYDVGVDGNPMLLIRKKKIPGAAKKQLKQKAIKKKLVEGRFLFDKTKGCFVFVLESNPGKLAKALKTYFGRMPALKKRDRFAGSGKLTASEDSPALALPPIPTPDLSLGPNKTGINTDVNLKAKIKHKVTEPEHKPEIKDWMNAATLAAQDTQAAFISKRIEVVTFHCQRRDGYGHKQLKSR